MQTPILDAIKLAQKTRRIKSITICEACDISPTDFSSYKAGRITLPSSKLERIVSYLQPEIKY